MRFVLLALFALSFTNSVFSYTIGTGDVLHIEVYGEPELALDLTVDSTGFVEYPFIGKLQVKEETVDTIKQKIVSMLKDGYFVNPQVTVAIKQYKPYYIQGEVRSPGSYPYEVGMTVRRAIAMAGGLTERASKKKIYLTHADSEAPKEVKVDMDASILSGDVILIKESFF
jgi:polysaccharide export outer membrane protein